MYNYLDLDFEITSMKPMVIKALVDDEELTITALPVVLNERLRSLVVDVNTDKETQESQELNTGTIYGAVIEWQIHETRHQ
ncbi:hypothetical protein [Vulcanisaeta souniana]|nr:hypothetical protein [Vulcanisaeta souniana]BDR91662.1 hypothetical protein Vsou_07550 [Vulcanisaeta souniana JCM 11219]